MRSALINFSRSTIPAVGLIVSIDNIESSNPVHRGTAAEISFRLETCTCSGKEEGRRGFVDKETAGADRAV